MQPTRTLLLWPCSVCSHSCCVLPRLPNPLVSAAAIAAGIDLKMVQGDGGLKEKARVLQHADDWSSERLVQSCRAGARLERFPERVPSSGEVEVVIR